MKDQLTDEYKYLEDKVVTDGMNIFLRFYLIFIERILMIIYIHISGNLITSRGPATAFAFGLAIVEKLLDKETADEVAKGMLYTK